MRIAILGAGPIGLDAALAAVERGHSVTVYERADTVGGHVRRWGHIRCFTPWEMNVSPRMGAALGQRAPAGGALPTGEELAAEMLEPVAALPVLAGAFRTATTVLAVGREGLLKHEAIGAPERARRRFRLLVRDREDVERVEHADAVIDATGTYGNPNRLGDGGIDAPGERAFERRITRMPEPVGTFASRTVLLTGAGHSAQTTAAALAELARDAPDTRVLWALRRPQHEFVLPEDPLPARDALHRVAEDLMRGACPAVEVRHGVVTEALAGGASGGVRVTLRNGAGETVEVDHVLALHGGAPDASLYRQLQIHECYASLGPINLAAQLLAQDGGGDCLALGAPGPEALRNPEPGFFILGAKSYGRNSQFLLRMGWAQVDAVFDELLAGPPVR
ncbi:MAG: FAD-dependent oxidoreductase [Solirubrobacteraceae bacterium]